jgi:oligopeptide/dipeptide ABC transporter ATP-binding protein
VDETAVRPAALAHPWPSKLPGGLDGDDGGGKSVPFRVVPDERGKSLPDAQGEFGEKASPVPECRAQDLGECEDEVRVGDIVGEGWLVHGIAGKREIRELASLLLLRVGLSADAADKFPHEFSGGQRQRIGIARAISLSPKLVVADEPVSSLDVSVQAQILNLLKDIQEEYGMAYLFVSHDLRVIRHMSETVAVMYLGKLMEVSPAEEFFGNPLHPYTRSLLAAVPMLGGAPREKIVLRGEIPSPVSPPPGCRFHTRCFMAQKVCEEVCPPLREVAPARLAACHFV